MRCRLVPFGIDLLISRILPTDVMVITSLPRIGVKKRRLSQQPPYPSHDLFLQEGYLTIVQRVISPNDTDFAFLLHLG